MATFVVVCVVFGAAAVQSVTGSGFGMLAAPVLALVAPNLVPGPLLVLTVVMMSLMLGRPRHWDLASIRVIGTAMVPGVALGTWVLAALSVPVVEIVVACASIGAGVVLWSGRAMTTTRTTLAGAGLAAGVMGTLAAMPGPPIALSYHRVDPRELRATLSLFFLLMAAVGVSGLAWQGRFARSDLALGALLIPVVLAGNLIGRRVAPKVAVEAVTRLTTVAILIGALMLLGKGVLDVRG